MYEKIVIGFIGALLALALRELFERCKQRNHRKKLAKLCVNHLAQIKEDLKKHVQIQNEQARFDATQYCEIVVGDFLYDLITKNISVFPNINSLKYTIEFFHHYKVNMSTVSSRLAESNNNIAYLREGTYNNLLIRLQKAIDELKKI